MKFFYTFFLTFLKNRNLNIYNRLNLFRRFLSNKTRLIVEGRETEERVRLALQQINIIQGYTINLRTVNIKTARK